MALTRLQIIGKGRVEESVLPSANNEIPVIFLGNAHVFPHEGGVSKGQVGLVPGIGRGRLSIVHGVPHHLHQVDIPLPRKKGSLLGFYIHGVERAGAVAVRQHPRGKIVQGAVLLGEYFHIVVGSAGPAGCSVGLVQLLVVFPDVDDLLNVVPLVVAAVHLGVVGSVIRGLKVDVFVADIQDPQEIIPDTVLVFGHVAEGVGAPRAEIPRELVVVPHIFVVRAVHSPRGGHGWIAPRRGTAEYGLQLFHGFPLVERRITGFEHDGGLIIGGVLARDVVVGLGDGIQGFSDLLAFQLILVLPTAGAACKGRSGQDGGQDHE